MIYERPQMLTLSEKEISEIVAECFTCASFFRCGSFFSA